MIKDNYRVEDDSGVVWAEGVDRRMHLKGSPSPKLEFGCSWRWCSSVQAVGRQAESLSAGMRQAERGSPGTGGAAGTAGG